MNNVIKEELKEIKEIEDKNTIRIREALNTPFQAIKGEIEDIGLLINIIIKRLDLNYYNTNGFADCEEWHDGKKFNDIEFKYIGEKKDKLHLLDLLSDLINSIDTIKIRGFYEFEPMDKKSGIYEKWQEELRKNW